MKFSFKKTKRSVSGPKKNHVVLWWNTAILTSVLINIGIVFGCLYVFREVDRGEFFVSQKTERSLGQVIDPEQLHAVVGEMAARHEQLEQLKVADVTIIDPSL